jgi:hypothetical protein
MILHYLNVEEFSEVKCVIMVAQNLFPLLKFFYQDALRVFSDKFGRTESTVYHIIGMVSQFFFD